MVSTVPSDRGELNSTRKEQSKRQKKINTTGDEIAVGVPPTFYINDFLQDVRRRAYIPLFFLFVYSMMHVPSFLSSG